MTNRVNDSLQITQYNFPRAELKSENTSEHFFFQQLMSTSLSSLTSIHLSGVGVLEENTNDKNGL